MKLGAIAIDYDGTIAVDGVFDPSVRSAIAELRLGGIAVILVTGRRLEELRQVAGNLGCFNAVVAENGALLYFPETGRQALLGHPPPTWFLDTLKRQHLDVAVGQCVLEAHASAAPALLALIREQELALALAFNRQRLMVLPMGIAKSTGLRRALWTLRMSIHNTIGIGDAENDHDLLDACEVGVAVEWGSPALRGVADEIIPGSGPPAVAAYLRSLIGQVRLSSKQMGRRRLLLGYQHDGRPLHLAIRGRTVLVAGEPASGKSWIAGLLCEQLIVQGYCLCIIDPEGDYRSLEALPGVTVLGGDDPLPRARELTQVFRYSDASVVIDLSKVPHPEKRAYLHELLPVLAALRRESGLPHKIVLDEAHYYLAEPEGRRLIDPELAGYVLVTYRVSGLDPEVRSAADDVIIVTRETSPEEQDALLALSSREDGAVSRSALRTLAIGEAALLPGADEAEGRIQRFQLAPRLTSHVRHRQKYIDMPVSESHAFVFDDGGPHAARARSVKDMVELLGALPDDRLEPFFRRHDISRWLEQVFRDCPLATFVRTIESRAPSEPAREIADDIAQAIRARYEIVQAEPSAS